MEAMQRPTLRLSSPQVAPISFGQFGNQNPLQALNLTSTPPLPLTPNELLGIGGDLGGGSPAFIGGSGMPIENFAFGRSGFLDDAGYGWDIHNYLV